MGDSGQPTVDSCQLSVPGCMSMGSEVLFADGDVAVASYALAAFAIKSLIVGLVGAKAIDVAVVHAEGGGDEDGVVNLKVGCALLARGFDVGGGDEFAVLLHLAGDDEECFELGTDGGLGEIGLDLLDKGLVAAQVRSGNGAVDAVAVVGAVAAGNISGDELAFATG